MKIEGTRFETGRRYYSNRFGYRDVIIYDVSGKAPNRVGMVKFFAKDECDDPNIFREGANSWFDSFLRGEENVHYDDTPPVEEPEVGETWGRGEDEITAEHKFYMMRDGKPVKHFLLTIAYGSGADDSPVVAKGSEVFDLFPKTK